MDCRYGALFVNPPARSRAELTQRERIVRAAALVATERGYEVLGIPTITSAAGVSNQTFYEHFSSAEEAFIAAFDTLAGQALRATAAASGEREDWAEAVGAWVRGLLEFIAANRVFARLAFFELPTAGPEALDRAELTTRRFTSFLEPDALPDKLGATLPAVVIEAIGGGMWAVIQHEIAHGRAEGLPQMAPEIAGIALVPIGLEGGGSQGTREGRQHRLDQLGAQPRRGEGCPRSSGSSQKKWKCCRSPVWWSHSPAGAVRIGGETASTEPCSPTAATTCARSTG